MEIYLIIIQHKAFCLQTKKVVSGCSFGSEIRAIITNDRLDSSRQSYITNEHVAVGILFQIMQL